MKNKEIVKLNLGPQHPSTHGVLRLLLELEDEKVISAEPQIGYLHRGMEKLAESRTYLQYMPMVDRIDYLTGFMCQEAYCSAVEKLLNIELSKKVKYIRTMLCELARVSSHLLWLGTFIMDLGAQSPFFYAMTMREQILTIFENITGQRMMPNFHTFGGVKHNLTDKDYELITIFSDSFAKKMKKIENILTKNPIFKSRTENIGIISQKKCLQYSITGANLRASGIAADFRKINKYLAYNEMDFDIPTETKSDAYARYIVRIKEMYQSIRIINQCLEYLRTDKEEIIQIIKNPANIKPEAGEVTSNIESSRGLLGCSIISDGGKNPLRVKWRTPSFYSVQILPTLLKNVLIPDIMAIFGSLDVILPEVDR